MCYVKISSRFAQSYVCNKFINTPSFRIHPRDYVYNTVSNITHFAWTKRIQTSYYTHIKSHEKNGMCVANLCLASNTSEHICSRDDIHNNVTNITFCVVKEKTCVMSKSHQDSHKVMHVTNL